MGLLVAMGCNPSNLIVLPDGGPPATDAPRDTSPEAIDAGSDAPTPALSAEILPAGFLSVARVGHTLTVLPNGHALVIGGEDLSRAMNDSVEEFDPATNTWTEVATLPAPRSNHTATLLADGRVLVVGGGRAASNGLPTGISVTSTTLLYDPEARTFETTDALSVARSHHAAVQLPDGSVLVVGGAGADETSFTLIAQAERYVVSSGTFEPAGTLLQPRAMMNVVLDADDRPLVLGGLGSSTTFSSVDAVERWEDGTFVAAGALANGGRFQSALRTDAGDVVVAGGLGAGFLDTTEVLRADASDFVAGPDLPTGRNSLTLVETDRGILAIGGFFFDGGGSVFEEVLLLDLEASTVTTIGSIPLGRAAHRAVVLDDGDVLVAGGYNGLGEADAAFRVRVSE